MIVEAYKKPLETEFDLVIVLDSTNLLTDLTARFQSTGRSIFGDITVIKFKFKPKHFQNLYDFLESWVWQMLEKCLTAYSYQLLIKCLRMDFFFLTFTQQNQVCRTKHLASLLKKNNWMWKLRLHCSFVLHLYIFYPPLVCARYSAAGCLQVMPKRVYHNVCHIQLKAMSKNVSYLHVEFVSIMFA